MLTGLGIRLLFASANAAKRRKQNGISSVDGLQQTHRKHTLSQVRTMGKESVKVLMSPTESQIRARKKYREKQEYLQARVSPEEKLAIAEHVNATNESLSDFIRRAIKETMERDNATKNLDFK